MFLLFTHFWHEFLLFLLLLRHDLFVLLLVFPLRWTVIILFDFLVTFSTRDCISATFLQHFQVNFKVLKVPRICWLNSAISNTCKLKAENLENQFFPRLKTKIANFIEMNRYLIMLACRKMFHGHYWFVEPGKMCSGTLALRDHDDVPVLL